MSVQNSMWVAYEPQPPRCYGIVVTDSNFDDVADYFMKSWSEDILGCSKVWDRQTGTLSLVLTFKDSDDKPYELTLKPWQVLVRPDDIKEPYEVVDYHPFARAWRERLSK